MHARVTNRILESMTPLEKQGLLYCPKDQLTQRACRARVRNGMLVEPVPGLFARAECWERSNPWTHPYRIIRSLAHVHPGWVFTSFSAACIYGLPVSIEFLDRIHIAVPSGSHSGGKGLVVRHPMALEGDRRVMGVRVASLERVVVDCMREAPFPEALAIADGALRLGDWPHARLVELTERYGAGRPGIREARRVAQYADARAESGGESVARGVMIEEGFAVPDLQTVLPNVLDPNRPFRVDGSWRTPDGRLIAFEADGEEKYRRFASRHGGNVVRKMMKERQREALLTAACDALIRFDFRTVKAPGALARLLDSYGVPRA